MKYLHIYKSIFAKENRKQLATVSTMIGNTVLGAVHIVLSVVELSLFLGFSGVFNIMLALGKLFALERLLRLRTTDEKTRNAAETKNIDRINNCTLIYSSLFFSFGVVITFFYEDPAKYDLWMIYFITACTAIKVFAFFITALINFNKNAGIKQYVRRMAAAALLISLALTQRAVLYYADVTNASVYSGIGTIFFSLLSIIISLFMIKKASKNKKYLIKNDLIEERAKEGILIMQVKNTRHNIQRWRK